MPVLDEEGNILLFYSAIKSVFAKMDGTPAWEIVYVNDGSTDKTWEAIIKLAKRDRRIRGVCLSRNFGKDCALTAGMRAAGGDAIITIDGDLEHPPALIPKLIEHWRQGYDVVETRRMYSKETSAARRMTSRLFYALFNVMADVKLESGCSDYRLISQKVAAVFSEIDERDPFHRGLARWVGFRRVIVEFEAGTRTNGSSSYGFRRLVGLVWTALLSFSTLPMKAIIMLGMFMSSVSATLLLVMAYVRWVIGSEYFTQMAFLIVSIILSNGIILISVGIVAMYLLKIYKEVQHRPAYVVWRTINMGDSTGNVCKGK